MKRFAFAASSNTEERAIEPSLPQDKAINAHSSAYWLLIALQVALALLVFQRKSTCFIAESQHVISASA